MIRCIVKLKFPGICFNLVTNGSTCTRVVGSLVIKRNIYLSNRVPSLEEVFIKLLRRTQFPFRLDWELGKVWNKLLVVSCLRKCYKRISVCSTISISLVASNYGFCKLLLKSKCNRCQSPFKIKLGFHHYFVLINCAFLINGIHRWSLSIFLSP